MPGQTFAYLRVSKFDQDLEKNKLDILKLAHEQRLGHVEFVEEKISGKISWRKRQIAVILEQVQGGMPSLSASYPVWGQYVGVHGNSFPGSAEGYSCLRRERQLATQQQHPE